MGWRKGSAALAQVTPKPGNTQLMVWDPSLGDDQGQTWLREPIKNAHFPTSVLKTGYTEHVIAQ